LTPMAWIRSRSPGRGPKVSRFNAWVARSSSVSGGDALARLLCQPGAAANNNAGCCTIERMRQPARTLVQRPAVIQEERNMVEQLHNHRSIAVSQLRGLSRIARCGFPWEKTTTRPIAPVYSNRETALGVKTPEWFRSRVSRLNSPGSPLRATAKSFVSRSPSLGDPNYNLLPISCTQRDADSFSADK